MNNSLKKLMVTLLVLCCTFSVQAMQTGVSGSEITLPQHIPVVTDEIETELLRQIDVAQTFLSDRVILSKVVQQITQTRQLLVARCNRDIQHEFSSDKAKIVFEEICRTYQTAFITNVKKYQRHLTELKDYTSTMHEIIASNQRSLNGLRGMKLLVDTLKELETMVQGKEREVRILNEGLINANPY